MEGESEQGSPADSLFRDLPTSQILCRRLGSSEVRLSVVFVLGHFQHLNFRHYLRAPTDVSV